jgi:hypothetical protein
LSSVQKKRPVLHEASETRTCKNHQTLHKRKKVKKWRTQITCHNRNKQ